MKKTLMAIMITGACITPSLLCAVTPYVSANLGLGIANNSSATVDGSTVNDALSFKTGVPFGGAIGLNGEGYRVEAALGYQMNSADKILADAAASNDKVSVFTYMANAYYDIPMNSGFTPYVMGGLGGASIKPKGDNLEASSKSVFTWQLGLGVGVKATDNLVVDLGYRYLKPSSYTVTDPYYNAPAKFSAASSNILLGLRYNF